MTSAVLDRDYDIVAISDRAPVLLGVSDSVEHANELATPQVLG